MFDCLIAQRDKFLFSFHCSRLVTHFAVFILAELQSEVIPFRQLQVEKDLVKEITALRFFL